MKKLLILFACVLLLVGCSDASANVSNANSAIVTVGGKKITKGKLYELLKGQDQEFEVAMDFLISYIVNKEIETTPELEATAKENFESSKASMGEGFEDFLEVNGYKNEEDFYEREFLIPTKLNELSTHYIDENWDAVMENYYPTKLKIIETLTVEEATTALSDIKAGKTFEEVADEYSTKSADIYDGKEYILSRLDTSLPAQIVKFVRDNNTPTLSGILTSDNNADAFYIVQIINCNPKQFRDEAVDLIKTSGALDSEIISFYCKKLKFKVYDVSLYEFLEVNYPSYLNQ